MVLDHRARYAGEAPALAVLGAITVLALALRVASIGEPAVFDELYLYEVVHERSLRDALDIVVDSESTPPLYFVLAWAAAKVGGDDFLWIKLPSLLAGVATIPVLYWVGIRTVGRTAALIGAAFFALAPFNIFYGTEGRGYATVALLSALSTACLLELVRTGRKGWALGLAAATAGVLYTHYTGVFVVAFQFLWAALAYRDRLRVVLLAAAGAVLVLVPWIPGFLTQREDNTADRLEQFEVTLRTVAETLGRIWVGHPTASLGTVPGIGWMLITAGLLIVAIVAVRRVAETRALSISRESALLIGVALASPLGALLYSLGPENVYGARYLSASVPAVALLMGASLGWLIRRSAGGGDHGGAARPRLRHGANARGGHSTYPVRRRCTRGRPESGRWCPGSRAVVLARGAQSPAGFLLRAQARLLPERPTLRRGAQAGPTRR